MVMALTGDATWAGLAVGLMGLSRFLVAYPSGKITDTYGRNPGILFGLLLALVGSVIVGVSMSLRSFAALFAGMLVFGMGMNAAQQLRVAATDMFPPGMRARALGYVLMGSLVGVVLSPLLIRAGEVLAARIGQDPLAVAWLLLPLLIVPGMIAILMVRPDPKEIGMNLQHYYPEYKPSAPPPASRRGGFSTLELLGNVPIRLAIVANSAAQGNMSIVMVLTALVLDHHGHSLWAIAVSMALHSAGMFAFSIPIGRLADRYGRGKVMYPGVGITLIGAGLVSFTVPYWSVTLGTFLVGLGWSAANIAATAAIADHVETVQRGRAIGVADTFAGAASVLMALVTGPLIFWFGLSVAGLTAILVAAVPLVMRLAYRPI
jgi:MFS family permease